MRNQAPLWETLLDGINATFSSVGLMLLGADVYALHHAMRHALPVGLLVTTAVVFVAGFTMFLITQWLRATPKPTEPNGEKHV